MYMYIALRTEEQNLFQMIYHYKRQILSWVLVDQFDFHAFALCLKIDSTTCQVQIYHYCVWLITSKAMLWKGGGGCGSQEDNYQLVVIILLQTKLFHVCAWTGNLSLVSLLEQAMETVREISVKNDYECRLLSISKYEF